jgi:hypothetical protein
MMGFRRVGIKLSVSWKRRWCFDVAMFRDGADCVFTIGSAAAIFEVEDGKIKSFTKDWDKLHMWK